MNNAQLLDLFTHFASLSLLAVGGALSVVPDMHRYLVDETRWLSGTQFNAAIGLAQAAPGPNMLFVALMGCYSALALHSPAGILSSASVAAGVAGALVAMAGFLLPSSLLTLTTTGWLHRHRQHAGVRAFKAGLAPVAIALTLSTAWLLLAQELKRWQDWPLGAVALAALLLMLYTRTHLLLIIGLGALAGGLLGF
ncbi:MAG: chromate transporter [Burkholderiales bacterium]